MVDYLTKPFTEYEFVKMLNTYLKNLKVEISQEANYSNVLFNLKSIEMLPEKDQIDIIKTFISESSNIIDALKKASTKGKTDLVKFSAHKLKSHIKTFQISDLYDDIDDIEFNLDKLKKDEILRKIDHLERVLNDVYSQMT